MRLVCRQITWEGVSAVFYCANTVLLVQQLAQGRCSRHVKNAGGRAKGGRGEGEPLPTKHTAETVSADSVVPPPELCTLEQGLLGFARYYLLRTHRGQPTRQRQPGT